MNEEKGQATVETALTITILLFFLFAIIDIGRIFMVYIDLEHSGREAARVASLGSGDYQIIQVAHMTSDLEPTKLNVTILPSLENRIRGTYVTVNQSYAVNLFVPGIAQIIPNPYIVTNKTVMRVE